MNPVSTLLPMLFVGLLVIGFFIAIILLIVRLATRAGSGPARPPVFSRPNVLIEPADDGFWIVSCPANPDALLHYHYWFNGVRYTGQVPYQPGRDGRQFVYTGNRPEQTAVVRILDASDDDSSSLLPPIIAAESAFMNSSAAEPPDSPSPPSSSSSFPSAY
jgi:hypothetical protein